MKKNALINVNTLSLINESVVVWVFVKHFSKSWQGGFVIYSRELYSKSHILVLNVNTRSFSKVMMIFPLLVYMKNAQNGINRNYFQVDLKHFYEEITN